MLPQEQLQYLGEQVRPRLQEVGFEGFVIVGYIRDSAGRLKRICFADDGNDAAISDGLRPVITFAHMWGTSAPQKPEEKDGP